MKLIKPSFEVIDQQAGLDGIYRQIELAGRTCYKSENLITETSAKEFVDRMIVSGHGAMLEHGTVYLYIADSWSHSDIFYKYTSNKYSRVKFERSSEAVDNKMYITTNLRVLVENNWLDDLQYICEPTEYHEKRVTVKFICDRGVLCEFTRHRVFSFAAESTRYCNYSKDKFGNELTFIIPCWYNIEEGSYKWSSFNYGDESMWCGWRKDNESLTQPENNIIIERMHKFHYYFRSLALSEEMYFALLNYDKQLPQQARSVLPNSLKTELVMTGFASDWEHFFKLRCAQSAHPQARELAVPLEEYFKQNNIL